MILEIEGETHAETITKMNAIARTTPVFCGSQFAYRLLKTKEGNKFSFLTMKSTATPGTVLLWKRKGFL